MKKMSYLVEKLMKHKQGGGSSGRGTRSSGRRAAHVSYEE
jgi:hypothetical protein